MTPDPNTDSDDEEQKLLAQAMMKIAPMLQDRLCILIVAFEQSDGTKICSLSNLTKQSQTEMLEILLEGQTEIPKGATLN